MEFLNNIKTELSTYSTEQHMRFIIISSISLPLVAILLMSTIHLLNEEVTYRESLTIVASIYTALATGVIAFFTALLAVVAAKASGDWKKSLDYASKVEAIRNITLSLHNYCSDLTPRIYELYLLDENDPSYKDKYLAKLNELTKESKLFDYMNSRSILQKSYTLFIHEFDMHSPEMKEFNKKYFNFLAISKNFWYFGYDTNQNTTINSKEDIKKNLQRHETEFQSAYSDIIGYLSDDFRSSHCK